MKYLPNFSKLIKCIFSRLITVKNKKETIYNNLRIDFTNWQEFIERDKNIKKTWEVYKEVDNNWCSLWEKGVHFYVGVGAPAPMRGIQRVYMKGTKIAFFAINLGATNFVTSTSCLKLLFPFLRNN